MPAPCAAFVAPCLPIFGEDIQWKIWQIAALVFQNGIVGIVPIVRGRLASRGNISILIALLVRSIVALKSGRNRSPVRAPHNPAPAPQPLSSFIEWAIEQNLKNTYLELVEGSDEILSIASEASDLWDVDEPDRFVKLAIRYPQMLTHVLWKLIRENGSLWRGHYDEKTKEWTWRVRLDTFIFERLRESWEAFRAVAYENGSKETLPSWHKYEHDEIPF